MIALSKTKKETENTTIYQRYWLTSSRGAPLISPIQTDASPSRYTITARATVAVVGNTSPILAEISTAINADTNTSQPLKMLYANPNSG